MSDMKAEQQFIGRQEQILIKNGKVYLNDFEQGTANQPLEPIGSLKNNSAKIIIKVKEETEQKEDKKDDK